MGVGFVGTRAQKAARVPSVHRRHLSHATDERHDRLFLRVEGHVRLRLLGDRITTPPLVGDLHEAPLAVLSPVERETLHVSP